MIRVKNLSKKYGSKLALDNISFSVQKGEIIGFLGKNGAGKSTTMNIITGYLSSNSGDVIINGFDILENPINAKKSIGYLPETPPVYPDMTVKAYLNFVFDLKQIQLNRFQHIEYITKLIKIDSVYDRVIKNLSKGYRQRVGLAATLLGEPPILILDEPTVGLDPQQIIEIRKIIKNFSKNHTVIFSSHILSEVQTICDRIIVIDQGKIIADDTTENLVHSALNAYKYKLTIEGNKTTVISKLQNISGVKYVAAQNEVEPSVYEYILEADADIRRAIAICIENSGFMLLGLQKSDANLEEIFISLTKKQQSSNKELGVD